MYGLPDSAILGIGKRIGRSLVGKKSKYEPHEPSWLVRGVEKAFGAFFEGFKEGWQGKEKPKDPKKTVRFVPTEDEL
jgi:hypothetical protein